MGIQPVFYQMSQDQTPKSPRSRAPRRSKPTSTTQTPKQAAVVEVSVEERLKQLHEATQAQLRCYKELAATLAANSKLPPPEVVPEDFDLCLVCDLKLVAAEGTVVKYRARVDIPEALHPATMSLTLSRFNQIMAEQISNPLSARLMRYLTDHGLNLTAENSSSYEDDDDSDVPKLPTSFQDPTKEDEDFDP